MWISLTPQDFSAIVILNVFNHTYCYIVGHFPQPAFRTCLLGCGSNRICLESSVGGEVSLNLHPCIVADVLSHVLMFSDFCKVH